MENMLQNVVFDYQKMREHRIPLSEIEKELADYRNCCFPRSTTARKDFLNKVMLSDGAYGKVFKGYRVKNREEVAIKKFFEDDPEELSCSTLRELDSHLSFNHPNIVRVQDVFYKKKYFYLAMELCTGGDLFDYLRKKAYPTYPKKWVPQLLRAVDYLHKRNWIQRDLKTPNLLLDGEKNLKLTDFGLSRKDYYGGVTNLEERRKLQEYTPDMMTLNYRSPEMLFGDNRYDLRVDCWSVGCIIGEIYLRSYLFHGDDELEVIKNIFKALGFPDEDAEWTNRYKNWYIWQEHFQHLTDVRIKDRFKYKKVEMPPAHWDVFLGLLQLDVEKRWHCIDCIRHIEKAGY
jgi:serine/threonine protein kinase